VIVCLPQLLDNKIEFVGKIHNFILDEAHEWYFVNKFKEFNGTVAKIVQKSEPKFQLLLTGTPFIFNQKKEDFRIFYVPVIELLDRGFISNVKIEIVSSSISFKLSDYETQFGNLKTSVKFQRKKDQDSLKKVCEQMVKKLKNPLKDYHDINRLTDNVFSIFNQLNKTLVLCRSTEQANHFFEALNSFSSLNGRICISHSNNDPNSEQFKLFEISEDMKVLIAVDRGRIGYNLPELYNIVDFTYSQNLPLLMQTLGRLFRIPKEKLKQQKIYYKVAPRGNSLYFEDVMAAVICLTHRNWYEKFNLKNMGEIKIPKFNKKGKSGGQRTKPIKANEKISQKLSLDDLEIPFDLNLFKNCALHKDSDFFSTISYTTLEEARKSFYNIKYTEITKEMIENIINLNQLGKTSYEIAEIVGCSRGSVNNIITQHQEKTFAALKQEKMKEEILGCYNDGSKPSMNQIWSKTGYYPPTISKILKENNLESWETRNIRKAEESVIKAYNNGKKLPAVQIAKLTGLAEGRVCQILKRFGLKDWQLIKYDERDKKIIELYHNGKKWSNERIGKEAGANTATVCLVLSKKNLTSWTILGKEKNDKKILDLYHNGEKLGTRKIGELAGVSEITALHCLKRNGLKNWTSILLEEKKLVK